jgi:simple sugar transport system substrate-binding protein
MLAGDFIIFAGGLKDNQGRVVIPAGAGLAQADPTLESMSYLVEGVVGNAGAGS